MDPFSPADLAAARHRLYALLGQLLCRGPLPEPLAVARQLPALAEHLDRGEDSLWEGHQSAIMGALPWASAWLALDGQLGGEIADQARQTLLSCGFDPGARDEPDHVGILLAGLSHLCAAEAELLQDNAPEAQIARLSPLYEGLFDLLLRFLPPLSIAVAEAGDRAWAAVAAFSLALCESHRAEIPRPAAAWSLPGGLPDPRDPELGLARIVKTLITPALSGVFLTLEGSAADDRWSCAGRGSLPRASDPGEVFEGGADSG